MGWKSKFIFILFIYFAGFATAIYTLAPATTADNQSREVTACESGGKSLSLANWQSEEFTQSLKAGMDKCAHFGKEAAIRVGGFIKQKIDERRQQKSET